MLTLTEGQCGLCEHFAGETEAPEVIQIRIKGEAPADLLEPCSHPKNAPMNLKVSPISGCEGFTPASK